jgi:hypothetical protein
LKIADLKAPPPGLQIGIDRQVGRACVPQAEVLFLSKSAIDSLLQWA